ncbi:MAG: hypothetical protein RR795_03465 [Cetobacterium sp.]|uniref:hypothetical protein n=1 Tax=Cetobacterium sp. TaxID=2071632 RepID=UPI002FC7ABCA
MKLYSFLYERGSYQKIYQSFNKKQLEKQRAEFELSFKSEGGPNKIGTIEEKEIDIINGVWTA